MRREHGAAVALATGVLLLWQATPSRATAAVDPRAVPIRTCPCPGMAPRNATSPPAALNPDARKTPPGACTVVTRPARRATTAKAARRRTARIAPSGVVSLPGALGVVS